MCFQYLLEAVTTSRIKWQRVVVLVMMTVMICDMYVDIDCRTVQHVMNFASDGRESYTDYNFNAL